MPDMTAVTCMKCQKWCFSRSPRSHGPWDGLAVPRWDARPDRPAAPGRLAEAPVHCAALGSLGECAFAAHCAAPPGPAMCTEFRPCLGVARTLTQACLPQPLPPACAVSASLRQSADRAALSDQLSGVALARQLTVSSASPFPAPSRQHAYSSQCRRW